MNLMKAYDSIRGMVLCNILIEFGIPVKLLMLVKMCLIGTYGSIWVGQHLSC